MNTVSKYALPAIAVPATVPSGRPALGHSGVDPVAGERPDVGRELILVDRQSEPPVLLGQEDNEPALRLVSLSTDSDGRAANLEGAASIRFRAQVYGQSSEPAGATVMDGHRDAPQIGTAAYLRADAVSGIYPEQAAVFSFAV